MADTAKRFDLQPNVAGSAATLGLVGWKRTQPHRGWGGLEFDTQGSRNGNPGLEVATASRYFSEGILLISDFW